VLVIEDRHGPPAGLEDLDDFLEEAAARVEDLSLVVAGIIAVLGHEEHAIDGQLVAAQRQRLGDALEHGDAPAFGQGPADVEVRHLIDVQRCHPARRWITLADDAEALHEARDDVVGVAVAKVRGDNGGDLLIAGRRIDDGAAPRPCQQRGRAEGSTLL
jgi:hypothetical protein